MADVSKFLGCYSESGYWRDASGNSGELRGGLSVSLTADQLQISTDDGHTMVAQPSMDSSQPMRFEASGGGTSSAGTVYIGEQSLILEYTASVNGRRERNVDIWTVSGRNLQRAGIIRQDGRTIWFEAAMNRTG